MDAVIQKLKALGCDASKETIREQLDQLKQKKRDNAEEAARDVQEKFVDFASLLTHINRILSLSKSLGLHSDKFSLLTTNSAEAFSDVITRCDTRDKLQAKYDQAMHYVDFFELSEEMSNYISLADYMLTASQEDLQTYLQALISLKNKYFFFDLKAAEKVNILDTTMEQLKQQNTVIGGHLNTFLTRIDIQKLADTNISSLFFQNQGSTRIVVENIQVMTRKLTDFAPRFETLLRKVMLTEEQASTSKIILSPFGKLCSYGFTLSNKFKDVFLDSVIADVFPFTLSLVVSLPWDMRYGLLQRISFMGLSSILSEELLRLVLLIVYNQIVLVIFLNHIYAENFTNASAANSSATVSPTQPSPQPLLLGSSPTAISPSAQQALSIKQTSPATKSLSNSVTVPDGVQQSIFCWSDFLFNISVKPKELLRTQNMCHIGPILDQKQIQISFAQGLPIFEQVDTSSFTGFILNILYMTTPMSNALTDRLKKNLGTYFDTMRYLIDGLGFLVNTIPGITQGITEQITNLFLVQLSQFITTRKTDIILFNSVALDALKVAYHLLSVLKTLGTAYSEVTRGVFDFIASLEASLLKSYIFVAQSISRAVGMCSLINLTSSAHQLSMGNLCDDLPTRTDMDPANLNSKNDKLSVKDEGKQVNSNEVIKDSDTDDELLEPIRATVRNNTARMAYDYGVFRQVHSVFRLTLIQEKELGCALDTYGNGRFGSLCILAIVSLIEHTSLFISTMKSITIGDMNKSLMAIIQGYIAGAMYSFQALKEYQTRMINFKIDHTYTGVFNDISHISSSGQCHNFEFFDKRWHQKLFGSCTMAIVERSVQQFISDCLIVQQNLLPLLASKFNVDFDTSENASLLGQLFDGISLLTELQYHTEVAKPFYSEDAIMQVRAELDTSNLINVSAFRMRPLQRFGTDITNRRSTDLATMYSFDESKVILRTSQSVHLMLTVALDLYLDLLVGSIFPEIDELVADICTVKTVSLFGVMHSGLSDTALSALHQEAVNTITNPSSIEFTPLINQIFSLSCLHNVLVSISKTKNKLVQNGLIERESLWTDIKERIFAYLKHHTSSALIMHDGGSHAIFAMVLNFLSQTLANRDVMELRERSSEIKTTLDLVTQTLQLKFKRLVEA